MRFLHGSCREAGGLCALVLGDYSMPTSIVRDRRSGNRTGAEELRSAAGDASITALALTENIFLLKETHFVLWRARASTPPPSLVIGTLNPGAPVTFTGEQRIDLAPRSAGDIDLWVIPAADCNLDEGQVYHYWFEVTDVHPERTGRRIRVTDPMAFMVDWRLLAERLPDPYTDADRYPAAVIKYDHGRLIACDAGGETGALTGEPPLVTLPSNNRLCIYEMPVAWSRIDGAGARERGVGTFRDVTALVAAEAGGANFSDLEVTQPGQSYLVELGINALELLPPVDSFYVREWGYGSTNFFAPDFELGFPMDSSHPTPNRDLRALVATCHANGIRVFQDVVMAFARAHAYLAAATDDFFILNPGADQDDPDAKNSRPEHGFRNGFGSTLFRYARFREGYDPLDGTRHTLSPARELMKASLVRWMRDFHIDGFRLDSVENIANWDFVEEYKDLARDLYRTRSAEQGSGNTADARFLVVGEELSEPQELLVQKRLDGLWHESFKRYIRRALVGRNADDEPSFEWTVRKAIDCRLMGYDDGAQAIIYLGSHDVEGFRNERLFNYLRNNGVVDAEKRIKLGFACLLTAVGIPQILAGDEFADQHDLFDANGNVTQSGHKQVDPVNYSRLADDWRRRIRDYVARLVALRTTSDALATNDIDFIHIDFDGKRVMAWRRGQPGSEVVVVANFSDFATDTSQLNAEYRVHNWPATPPGRRWREISQARDVPTEWVGREPLYSWEAKVYALT